MYLQIACPTVDFPVRDTVRFSYFRPLLRYQCFLCILSCNSRTQRIFLSLVCSNILRMLTTVTSFPLIGLLERDLCLIQKLLNQSTCHSREPISMFCNDGKSIISSIFHHLFQLYCFLTNLLLLSGLLFVFFCTIQKHFYHF